MVAARAVATQETATEAVVRMALAMGVAREGRQAVVETRVVPAAVEASAEMEAVGTVDT